MGKKEQRKSKEEVWKDIIIKQMGADQITPSSPTGTTRVQTAMELLGQRTSQLICSEVQKGRAVIRKDACGEALRIVPLVALNLIRHDGLVLARLGKWKRGVKPKIEAVLPGGKIQSGSTPQEALEKVIATDLPQLRLGITVGHFDTTVEERESASVGMTTRYIRATYHCKLDKAYSYPQDTNIIIVPRVASVKSCSSRSSIRERFALSQGQTTPSPPDIFAPLWGETEVDLFAWVPTWEFDWLRDTASRGKATLGHWFEDLDMDTLGQACLERMSTKKVHRQSSKTSIQRVASTTSKASIDPRISTKMSIDSRFASKKSFSDVACGKASRAKKALLSANTGHWR